MPRWADRVAWRVTLWPPRTRQGASSIAQRERMRRPVSSPVARQVNSTSNACKAVAGPCGHGPGGQYSCQRRNAGGDDGAPSQTWLPNTFDSSAVSFLILSLDFQGTHHGVQLGQIRGKGVCGLRIQGGDHICQIGGEIAGEFGRLIAGDGAIRRQAGMAYRQHGSHIIFAVAGQTLVGVNQFIVIDGYEGLVKLGQVTQPLSTLEVQVLYVGMHDLLRH